MNNILDTLSEELTALANNAAPWVVRVNGRRGPSASGVLWSDTQVVTSHRGTHRESEIEVGLADGSVVLATVSGRAPDMDFAILTLETPVEAAPTPWSQQPNPGLMMALARDRQGNLLSKFGLIPGEKLVHRMAPAPEFLGSPLLDRNGQFLGLHLMVGRPSVVSHREILSLVERIDSGECLEPGFLGLGLHRVEHEGGSACLAVKVEGPAKEAGLKVGDIVTTLDNLEVSDPAATRDVLRAKTAGSAVEIAYVRAGQNMACSVELGSRPGPDFPRHMKHHIRKVIRHFKHHHHHRHHGPHHEGPEIC